MDLIKWTGFFKRRSPFRRDKKLKIARTTEHTRAPARFYPGCVRKISHNDIYPDTRQVIEAGGDQRRQIFRAPETINQSADLQIPEVMIDTHPFARHYYPPRVTLRALSNYPESNVAMIVRGIDDI